jgi:hypothetical protein
MINQLSGTILTINWIEIKLKNLILINLSPKSCIIICDTRVRGTIMYNKSVFNMEKLYSIFRLNMET